MPTCWPTSFEKIPAGKRRAFTIVESLVALTITGIATIAVIGALSMAAEATDRLRDQCHAQQLAEERLVRLLQAPGQPSGNQQGVTGKFLWEETVQPRQTPGTTELIVTVRWMHKGRIRTFGLASIKWLRQQGRS